ncbi:MAG TPA: hypothetical protein VER96_35790 [Polyangiaceae bacterium]|nr:hypothetical protein [Polyangiaceae bacterium]
MSLAHAGGVACRKTPEPPGAGSSAPTPQSPGPVAQKAAADSASPPVDVTWVDPPGLRRVPPKSAMRKASYEVPRANGDGEDGELAVFYFGPGQGGSIDANVDRWVKQFSDISPNDVKRADREANGLRQHTVEIERGTFDAGQMAMGGNKGPRKDYALEGAIVETPGGAYFFKMTGPSKTVLAARGPFLQLLDSVRTGR